MADIATPSHGKLGAIYRQRKNNFTGSGLNDCSLGTGYSGGASAYYEIQIDGNGTPDTFKWRKNGGSWTTTVAITGAAQTLDSGQTVTFTATTGHTLGDRWIIANFKTEACTSSGTTAQITDATKRILNPAALPVFTDSGGAKVQWVDPSSGMAYFDKNVGTVTATGNNAYITSGCFSKLGYLTDWNMTINVDTVDISALGDSWKSFLPGMGGGKGGAGGYYIGATTLLAELQAEAAGTQPYTFLQLFTYDPDQDGTGSHFNVWVLFDSWDLKAGMNDVVKKTIGWTFEGKPSYVANS